MATFKIQQLVELLADDDRDIRTAALTVLSEGYANDRGIVAAILNAWDRFGPDKAFADFAMLSYVPADAELLPEVCERATKMAEGRGLTDPITRAAGKLVEQQMQLPAASLEPHMQRLRDTVSTSKIFFRVDLGLQAQRIELLGKAADEIAGHLDEAIAAITANDKDDAARQRAIVSLEALRRQHPNYLDLHVALAGPPKEGGPAWSSFCVTLQSLIQFAQPGLESHIGQHLLDHREFVYSMAVEALARCGSREAASQLLMRFEDANSRAQHWIARGLQRVRSEGVSAKIGELDASDPHLKGSLFVAQLKQLDESNSHLAGRIDALEHVPANIQPLIRLNQRIWPESAAEVHTRFASLLKRVDKPAAAGRESDAAAAQKREAIRNALRRQLGGQE